jgi:hypothetical protein
MLKGNWVCRFKNRAGGVSGIGSSQIYETIYDSTRNQQSLTSLKLLSDLLLVDGGVFPEIHSHEGTLPVGWKLLHDARLHPNREKVQERHERKFQGRDKKQRTAREQKRGVKMQRETPWRGRCRQVPLPCNADVRVTLS